jgi:hypothetical protein
MRRERLLDVSRSVGGRTMIARSVRFCAICAAGPSRLCTVKFSDHARCRPHELDQQARKK